MTTKLEPCPCCRSPVDWMTSRDGNVGEIYIQCGNEDCELSSQEHPFYQHYMVFEEFEDEYPLIETICERWNLWCKTNPTRYRDVYWETNNA